MLLEANQFKFLLGKWNFCLDGHSLQPNSHNCYLFFTPFLSFLERNVEEMFDCWGVGSGVVFKVPMLVPLSFCIGPVLQEQREKKTPKVGEALAPALSTVQLMKTISACSQQGSWFQLSCLHWDRWVVRIHGGAITGYSRWTEKGKKQSCLWIDRIRRARGRWAAEIMLPLTVNK